MRIHVVNHTRKRLKCSRCGDLIRPARNVKRQVTNTLKKMGKTVRVSGDSYRWIKHRHRARVVRCMKQECRFRRSDLTTSDKLGRVYDAQDYTNSELDSVFDEWKGHLHEASSDDLTEILDRIRSILENLSAELREVADEYRDSASNIEDRFTNSPTADDCTEKADSLDEWADTIDSVDLQEWESAGDITREDWWEENHDEARGVIEECPL